MAAILNGYYGEKLAAGRLRDCYDVAPPRVRRYLEAEIDFVLERTSPSSSALELGCGYGRVLRRILPSVRRGTGIDTSLASLRMAREFLGDVVPPPRLLAMDAASLGFRAGTFDLTFCIQNGICVFGVDPLPLASEALRVTRPGGIVLFSSYAACFWQDRLEWFEAQAARGLIGPIDREATRDGVIACTDGFRATTMAPGDFESLARRLGVAPRIFEVEASSLFCEFVVP